ncbi:MAG TPA: hypothetical protein VGQ18_05115 [Gemmatimonadales bacterium]|jgi:hypothetical protein|nr:hypothetical protein [Gemmatimonadales bacterium]
MNWKAEIAVVALAVAACAPPPRTPAPSAVVTNAAVPGQRGAVLAYAKTLEFDTITHGAGDEQALTLLDSRAVPPKDTIGPIGTIVPERNTHHNTETDLSGVGRIVARIYSTGPYPKLGLTRGLTYFWVDSLVMITPDSGRGRAIFIPADSSQPVMVRELKFTTDRAGARERQPLARWRYYPLHSELPWERCTKMGCCEAL